MSKKQNVYGCSLLFSYAHGYFFTVIHNIKVNGVDLMKHHLQIN